MSKSKSFTWQILFFGMKLLLSLLGGCAFALFMAITNLSYEVQVLAFFTGTVITFVRLDVQDKLIEQDEIIGNIKYGKDK